MPKLRSGITEEEWCLFIDKLIQFNDYIEGRKKENEFYEKRNDFIVDNLQENFRIAGQREAVMYAVAKKVFKAFLEALHAVAATAPLSNFLVVRRSVACDECVFQFVCMRVLSCLEQLTKDLSDSTARSPQDCLKFVRCAKISDEKAEETRARLALGKNNVEFNEREFANALNPLLASLDATIGRALAETAFDFVLEVDDQGSAKESGKMTFVEYFDAKAKEWNEMIDSMTGKSNGARLAEVESTNKEPREKFLDTAEIEKLPPLSPEAVAALRVDSSSSSYNSSGSDSSGSGYSGPPKKVSLPRANLPRGSSSSGSGSPKGVPRPKAVAPVALPGKVSPLHHSYSSDSGFGSGSPRAVPRQPANLSKWSSSSSSDSGSDVD
jgi:hypothetical protein